MKNCEKFQKTKPENLSHISSVVMPKAEFQSESKKINKARPNFPKSNHYLLPDTHTYVSVNEAKNCSFFRKFECAVFLLPPEICLFALLRTISFLNTWLLALIYQKVLENVISKLQFRQSTSSGFQTSETNEKNWTSHTVCKHAPSEKNRVCV